MRRQLVRLANLSSVMALRRLSTPVAKRFPTFQHLVQVQYWYSTVQEGTVQYTCTVQVEYSTVYMYSTAKRFPTFQHLVQVVSSNVLLHHSLLPTTTSSLHRAVLLYYQDALASIATSLQCSLLSTTQAGLMTERELARLLSLLR